MGRPALKLEMRESTVPSPSSSPILASLEAQLDNGTRTPRRRSFNPSANSLPRLDAERALAELKRSPRPLSDQDRVIPAWLPAYLPLLAWVLTSLVTALLVSVFHSHVFSGLESLSHYLKQSGASGYALIFAVIAFTCIPPCPFYGTLIILTGYTFGVWRGFAVSYAAALSGAVAVYLLCRLFFRETMAAHLRKSPGMRKVITACSVRPRLLFLIRLAPYPYNLVNALAAASDQLTFSTYFWCTALALPKLLVHTSIGASIRSFVRYHQAASMGSGGPSTADGEPPLMDEEGQRIKFIFGGIGIALAVGAFVWLFLLARKAIDEVEEPWNSDKRTTPLMDSPATLAGIEIERPQSI